jgi:hypothetical protein
MRNTWSVIDVESGVVEISITADTDARGIAIEKSYNWHSYAQIENIVALLTEANAWLLDNGGVV